MVHLQGMGDFEGTKVADLKVGDRLMWNYGQVTTVKAIIPTRGKKMVEMIEEAYATGKWYKTRRLLSREVVKVLL